MNPLLGEKKTAAVGQLAEEEELDSHHTKTGTVADAGVLVREFLPHVDQAHIGRACFHEYEDGKAPYMSTLRGWCMY